MNILVRQSLITAVECDLLLVPVLQEQEKSEDINLLDTALNGALQEQIIRPGFKGKEKETLLCQTHGRLATQVLLLIGLGKEGELEEDTWRRVAGKGRKEAGAITAALFLEEFAGNIPWAHLDIAGPAFVEKDFPYIPKGGTGFGVRTLVRYLLSL
jgi:leucyl aminopeptidase